MTKRLVRVCLAVATIVLAGCSPSGPPQVASTAPAATPTLSASVTAADEWTVPASKLGVAIAAPIPTGWFVVTSPNDMVMSNTPFGQTQVSATLLAQSETVPAGTTVQDKTSTYVALTDAVPGISNVSAPRDAQVDGRPAVSIDYSIEEQGQVLSGTMTWVIVGTAELNLTQAWAPDDTAGAAALVDIQSNMRIG